MSLSNRGVSCPNSLRYRELAGIEQRLTEASDTVTEVSHVLTEATHVLTLLGTASLRESSSAADSRAASSSDTYSDRGVSYHIVTEMSSQIYSDRSVCSDTCHVYVTWALT